MLVRATLWVQMTFLPTITRNRYSPLIIVLLGLAGTLLPFAQTTTSHQKSETLHHKQAKEATSWSSAWRFSHEDGSQPGKIIATALLLATVVAAHIAFKQPTVISYALLALFGFGAEVTALLQIRAFSLQGSDEGLLSTLGLGYWVMLVAALLLWPLGALGFVRSLLQALAIKKDIDPKKVDDVFKW